MPLFWIMLPSAHNALRYSSVTQHEILHRESASSCEHGNEPSVNFLSK